MFTFARDHWATEEHIRASGAPLDLLTELLVPGPRPYDRRSRPCHPGPGGRWPVFRVALDDISRVARAVLLSPEEHADHTYDLTGPEELTLADAAAIVTEVTGQSTHYVDETSEEAYSSRALYGAPNWELKGWVTSYLTIAAGQQAGLSEDVERITGQRPVGLREILSRSERSPSEANVVLSSKRLVPLSGAPTGRRGYAHGGLGRALAGATGCALNLGSALRRSTPADRALQALDAWPGAAVRSTD